MSLGPKPLSLKEAETLALMALAYIAGNEEALAAFLRMTGITIATLRNNAEQPEVLTGVLRYLMEREDRLLAFCESHDLDPALPSLAFSSLEHHLGDYGYQDLN